MKMWKCIGLLLFFGQWILVNAESSEQSEAHISKNNECCPCPMPKSDDLIPSASTQVTGICPCEVRNADLKSAASIFSPVLSSAGLTSRQAQQKEVKHLLKPEVGLVSSVLDTLREATEKEYEEALAKDAKNTKQEEISNHVTIFVNGESTDANPSTVKDQESALPRNSLCYPHIGISPFANRPILGKSNDMNEAATIYHGSLNAPKTVESFNSYRNSLHNILESPIYDQPQLITPLNNILRFAPGHEKKYLLSHGRNNIFVSSSPFQTKPKEGSTAISEEVVDDTYLISRETVQNKHGNNLDPLFAENKHTNNCVGNDFLKTNIEQPVVTKIWDIIPNSDDHKVESKSSEIPDYLEETMEVVDDKQTYFDSNQRDTFKDADGVVEESRHKYTPSNDNNSFFLHRSFDDEFERSFQHDKETSSIKDNIVKTLGDFRQGNDIVHDKLQSDIDNVLQWHSARESLANDCSDVNLSSIELQERSNNDESMIGVNNFEDLLLKSSEQKILSPKELDNQNDRKLFPLQGFKSENNEHNNHEYERNADENNPLSCLVYGIQVKKNAYNDQNEMKMASSDISSTRFGISQKPKGVSKNSQNSIFNLQTSENEPIEDINLDIFQYHPSSLDQDNIINTQPSLPRLNMQSYKTKLPIPKSVSIKPVKLQKAFRKGNDLLGAVLTIEPHADNLSYKKAPQGKNSPNIFEPTLEKIPSFNELRSFLEHGANQLLKIQHLPRNYRPKLVSPLLNIEESAGNLKEYTEDALHNVQQSLSNILPTIQERNRNTLGLGESFINTNGLVESFSRNNLKMNEKIHDINNRLKSLFDLSRASYIQPISSIYKVRPKTLQTQSKKINVEQKVLNENQFMSAHRPSRLSINRDSNALLRKMNPKGSISKLKLLEDTPLIPGKIDTQTALESSWLSKTLNSRQILQKTVKPTENKSIIPFATQKKGTNVEFPVHKKSVLPNLERKLGNPSGFKNPFIQNLKSQLSREQKSSPSENIYDKVSLEDTPGQNVREENKATNLLNGIGQRSGRPSQILSKKFLLPNIAESSNLLKVKEDVNKNDNLRNGNNENKTEDIMSSSTNRMSAELPKETMTFDCKMVCNKS